MIRWLVIALFIYLMYRLITGPRRNRKSPSTFRFQFGRFDSSGSEKRQSSRKTSFEQIEEAEFEDITESEESEKERKK